MRQHFSPPLGIMSIGAYLRQNMPDGELKLIDMVPHGLSVDETAEKVKGFGPDIIGLSAMSLEASELAAVAAEVKKRMPDVPVIAGGPHPSTNPIKVLADTNIDYIVKGEGEHSTLELVNALADGGEVESIKGIGFRKDGEPFMTEPREEIVDLDSLPLPAYDLVDLPKYWELPRFGTVFANKTYAALSTSRACPYRCTYCHRIFGTKYRAQSADTVLRDLEELYHKHGVREIIFVDDCFNLDKKRVAAICDGMKERGLKFSISFPNGLRGDIMDEATLEKLKEAGTYRITYAIETASPRVQEFIKKNVKLDKLKEMISLTDKKNILVDGFFMVGFPGEKREEVDLTLSYAIESRLHTANFWFVTPFAGTELFEQAAAMGLTVTEDTETLHYFDPTTDMSEVPAEELKKKVQRTFLKFYLNPWRIWRIFRLFPNKGMLPSLFLRFLRISATWRS